jgi:hypothetical protein
MTLQQMLLAFLGLALLATLASSLDWSTIDHGIEWLAVATMPLWEPLWRPLEAFLLG